jgi:hypothetical protein
MEHSHKLTNPGELLPTIGGMFATSDHDGLLVPAEHAGFSAFFPESVRGKIRALYETGVDALAGILAEESGTRESIRLWTAENFCRESLHRLKLKLDNRIDFHVYRLADDLQNLTRADVVLYLHFNGYDRSSRATIDDIKRRNGTTVIEDFVHAPLDIASFCGDFAINSLRKFTSVDVAVAYQNVSQSRPPVETRYRVLHKEAEQIKSQFLRHPSEELEQRFLKLNREADSALAVREISSADPREIERAVMFDFQRARHLRRANYSRLAHRIHQEIQDIKILPGDYMYLMVELQCRDEVRANLFSKRIFPVIHWADAECQQVRSLLSFHIDQRYTPVDMDRVASAFRDIVRESGVGAAN